MGIFDRFKKEKKPEVSEREEKGTGEKKQDKKKKEASKTKAKIHSAAYRVIINPHISEKASFLSEQNKYVFIVSKKATKSEIARSIFDIYNVKPKSVRIINVLGKKRRYGRTRGKTSDYKKAIITLPKGKSIQIYEGV